MTISYAAVLSKLRRRYELGSHRDGSAHMGGGNGLKAGSGGKRSFSTLAGGNAAHKTFGSIPPASGKLGDGGKRPLSTILALTGCHEVKGNNNNRLGNAGGSRVVSGYSTYQLPTGSAVFRSFPHMAKPAEAVIVAPWARLLARLPRKW